MSKIKIIDELGSIEEAKDFAEAQYYTLISQSKKIKSLEDTIDEYTKKIQKLETEALVHEVNSSTNLDASDAESICMIQLKLLRASAMDRELTLEETKKVETYTKTLLLIKGKSVEDKPNKQDTSKMTTAQLLKLASEDIEQ